MSEKSNQLSVKVTIEVYEKGPYNNTHHVFVEKNSLISLDSDSPKRKIIDQVEDITQDLIREASDLIHHSKALTDGDIEREAKRTE